MTAALLLGLTIRFQSTWSVNWWGHGIGEWEKSLLMFFSTFHGYRGYERRGGYG